jgi:hypothetical protein
MLSTSPAATGSVPPANMIGTFTVARWAARAVVVPIATITSAFSSRSRARAVRFRRRDIPPNVAQQQSDVPAFFKPGRLQALAQPLDARLIGAALVNDTKAFDASLSAGRERPRAEGGRRENRCDDLPPPHDSQLRRSRARGYARHRLRVTRSPRPENFASTATSSSSPELRARLDQIAVRRQPVATKSPSQARGGSNPFLRPALATAAVWAPIGCAGRSSRALPAREYRS